MGCRHYGGPLDVVRNRCATCGRYWECYRCHGEATDSTLLEKMLIDAPLSTQCGSCGGFMPHGI